MINVGTRRDFKLGDILVICVLLLSFTRITGLNLAAVDVRGVYTKSGTFKRVLHVQSSKHYEHWQNVFATTLALPWDRKGMPKLAVRNGEPVYKRGEGEKSDGFKKRFLKEN